MRKKEILWLYVFLFAALADVAMIVNAEISYRYFTKPLIMIALLLYFFAEHKIDQRQFVENNRFGRTIFFFPGGRLTS
ncbi:hypothetical protein [Cyclobacterium qasimii]|uniref:hypothetical protein n=1 Tax=Cyclobacterium qasimii TaxID=1350429 RepID=UPI0026A5CDB0|nr:hypothetical protein [Cyclobacterium qasimii]